MGEVLQIGGLFHQLKVNFHVVYWIWTDFRKTVVTGVDLRLFFLNLNCLKGKHAFPHTTIDYDWKKHDLLSRADSNPRSRRTFFLSHALFSLSSFPENFYPSVKGRTFQETNQTWVDLNEAAKCTLLMQIFNLLVSSLHVNIGVCPGNDLQTFYPSEADG